MTNLEWIRTLSSEELADWFYDEWLHHLQYRWSSSRGGLIIWLNAKTENCSEKPNNCMDEFFREPTAEERKAVADYIDSISVPTGVNVFDLMDEPTISKMEQVDKDINVRCKESE